MRNADSFFEGNLRETLEKNAEHIMASEALKNRVEGMIKNQELEEESPMKKNFTIKKVAITVAALCFMMPLVAFAVGHISSYSSVSSGIPEYSEMPTAKELTQDIGFVPKAIDTFANGFRFKNANISDTQGKDDSGNVVEKFKDIDYTYVASDGREITLSINNSKYPVMEEDAERPNSQITAYNGIDLTYSEQKYKFLPPDYQMTAQDKKDEASGAVVFSYGTDQVETHMYKFLSWSDEGNNYLLMGRNIDLSQGDFVDMAKEIINQ